MISFRLDVTVILTYQRVTLNLFIQLVQIQSTPVSLESDFILFKLRVSVTYVCMFQIYLFFLFFSDTFLSGSIRENQHSQRRGGGGGGGE